MTPIKRCDNQVAVSKNSDNKRGRIDRGERERWNNTRYRKGALYMFPAAHGPSI
jgi:hypothetical protein